MTDMKRNADEVVNPRLDKLGRALGLEAMGKIMERTPVDTGRARANWNASIDSPDGTTTESTSRLVAEVQGRRVIRHFQLGEGETLYIANGLPYIERLEEGWSRQAPSGMAQITVMELEPLAQRIGARLNRG